MDCDKVLVLEQGRLCEYGSPQNLLENKDSMFYSLFHSNIGSINLN